MTATASVDRDASSTTRTLLSCGAVAGPLFLVVALTQAFTGAGFDLRRHPFSMFSFGELAGSRSPTSSSRACCSSPACACRPSASCA